MQILVVEDEPKVAAFLKQGLEESGHEVLCASDGIDGRRLAKEKAVDLVLLDVMLPGLNGVDTCREPDGGLLPRGLPPLLGGERTRDDEEALILALLMADD